MEHEFYCNHCKEWVERTQCGMGCDCQDDGSAENHADSMNDERWCEDE